jgi:signal transduction histidine kinase
VAQRDIKTQQIRFLLEQNSANTTYLLRAKNVHPLLPVFTFGNFEEVNGAWTNLHNIMLASYCIAVSFLLYNITLYLVTKDKSFAYYCLYIFSLFLVCVSGRSYLPFGIVIDPKVLYGTLAFSLASASIGAALFANSFLSLKERLPSVSKTLNISVLTFSILAPLGYYLDIMLIKVLFLLSMLHMTLYIFYAAFRVYMSGYVTGLYFMLSAGVGILLMLLYMVIFYIPNLLPITTWSVTLVHQAVVWDVIMLSLALAYRIKLLQEEKEQAQRLIAQKAKFTTIGETIGNIAHQWRQPLAALGAIITNMDAKIKFKKEIDKEGLECDMALADGIIKNLSQTIDTFQNFFHKSPDGEFEVSGCVSGAIGFMQGQLDASGIKASFCSDGEVVIKGSEDEFFQVVLIILNNAKDALVENKITDPIIDIKLRKSDTNITLIIEDNGGGIKLENIQDIFEPIHKRQRF